MTTRLTYVQINTCSIFISSKYLLVLLVDDGSTTWVWEAKRAEKKGNHNLHTAFVKFREKNIIYYMVV